MALPKMWHMYRMTRPAELTFSSAGMAICKVGLACSEKYGEKETTLFIDGTAFKKTAEMLNNVQKGQRVFVLGKLQTEQWDDKATGAKRYKTTMIIESFEFIEKRQDQQQGQSSNGQGNLQQQAPAQGGFQQPQQQGFQTQPQQGGQAGFQAPPDDDIPFSPMY